MTYNPVRAANSGELAKFRSDGQWSRYRLVIVPQPVILAAQVNQDFASTDQVATAYFDNVTAGSYADVVCGMTVYIGTAAGLADVGMARVKSATATQLKFARTSDVAWANNLYITVVDDFGIWSKQPLLLADGLLVDDDVAYTDQHTNMHPIPVMGPSFAVEKTGSSVTISLDGSNSYTLDGSTITAYAWTATGAASSTGTTTATPTFTFEMGGHHRVSLALTSSNGKTTTGHRVVYVVDAAHPAAEQVVINSLVGDDSEGGWSLNATIYADYAQPYDRAMVLLYEDAYYGGQSANMGQVTGLERMSFVGWISGESIEYNIELGTVTFTAHGPHHWADQPGQAASLIEDVTTTPDNWQKMEAMTVNKSTWHYLYWRSTVIEVCDVYLNGPSTRLGGMVASMGSVWSQVKEVVENRLAAKFRADRFGRLFLESDPQLMSDGSKDLLPVIMDITLADCYEPVQIERRLTSEVGVLEVYALSSTGGTENTQIHMSRAPGKALKRFGKPQTRDRLMVADQADCNTMAGRLAGKMNNPFPSARFGLAQNNKMIDIAPNQWVRHTTGATNPRGITWVNKRLLPKRVEMQHNADTGEVSMRLDTEPESVAELAVTVDAPGTALINLPDIGSGNPGYPIDIPGNINFPIVIPDTPTDDCKDNVSAGANGPHRIYFDRWIVDSAWTEDERVATAYYPCGIRTGSAARKTQLRITLVWQEYNSATGQWYPVEGNPVTLYCIDEGGGTLLTQTIFPAGGGSPSYVDFAPAGGLSIYGFKIIIAGGGETNTYYASSVDDVVGGYGEMTTPATNILGAPDGALATYHIYTNMGAVNIIVSFGQDFPNGGIVTLHGYEKQETLHPIFVKKDGVVVDQTTLTTLTTTHAFDQVDVGIDPPSGGYGSCDAVSVQAATDTRRRLLIVDPMLYNVCAP